MFQQLADALGLEVSVVEDHILTDERVSVLILTCSYRNTSSIERHFFFRSKNRYRLDLQACEPCYSSLCSAASHSDYLFISQTQRFYHNFCRNYIRIAVGMAFNSGVSSRKSRGSSNNTTKVVYTPSMNCLLGAFTK
jgi:hypothetical protein